MSIDLLLVEDNPDDAMLLQGTLDSDCPGEYAMTVVATLGEAKSLLAQQEFEAVLLDLSLPDSQGLGTIGQLAAAAPNSPIVVLTGVSDARIAPEAVRCGAQDYLLKGQTDGAAIGRAIHYAIDRKQIEEELRAQREALQTKNEELQETQKRLEAYRDRYVDLYDFAPLGYVTLDEEGYVQEINLAGARLLNADREVLTGYPFSEHVAKEDVPAFLEHLRKCVDGRCEMTSELRLAARGDRPITVQLHSISIKGPKEEVTLCKTAITDITQRKELEEAIRQSHAFLQTVMDAIPDPIMVVSRDYRIVLANRSARELSGEINIVSRCLPCYQASRRGNVPCADECHPCPLRQILDIRAPVTVTHTHYDAEGGEVFVEVTAAPVFDVAGEVTHIIEACRDITDRTRAEESLAQDRNLLRTLIDNLPDCIYVKDTQGRFIVANLATARLMGVATPNDLLGKADCDFFPSELATQYRADEEELMRSGQPLVNKDEPRLDENGVLRAVVTTKAPLKDGRGKIVGLVGISRDITDSPCQTSDKP